MNRDQFYKKLEQEYELIHDNYRYMEKFHTEDVGITQIARYENVLLEGDVSYWVGRWEEDTKHIVYEYCERRYSETDNIHLKVKYGWGLWAIGGKKDYQLLNITIERVLKILESYMNVRDYGHASTFCLYYKKVYIHCCKMGKTERMVSLVEKVMASDNETLKFQVLAMIYHQEKENEWIEEKVEGYEDKEQLHFLKKIDAHLLANTCLELAAKEKENLKYERLIEWAVLFSVNTNDAAMKKEVYEKLGDYKMTHLFPEQEGNIAPPHQNDILLREAMHCFKKAGNNEKLEQATLAYEANLPKKRFIRLTNTASVEEINRKIDEKNKYIVAIAEKGTLSIISHLLGYGGLDVFFPSQKVLPKIRENGKKLYYQTMMGAATEDSFHHSRETTHDKVMTFQIADLFYKNTSFDVYTCIICSGLKAGTLSIDILKETLMELGFDLEVSKTDADGQVIGTSYWERVDIGLNDFLRLIQDYAEQKDVDWRYCLTFLSNQFEGLLRDIVTKLGGATTRIKKEKDTELIPLEGLLSSECLTKVFSEDDLFMFKMAFTKDGYNIRNDVAHGMLLPQEYNSMRSMLVFVSIIRLSKATSYIVDMNGKKSL